MAKKFKVLWAINPFDEDQCVFDRSIEVLKLLNKAKAINLIPVFVLSPETLKFAGQLSVKDLRQFAPEARAKIETKMHGLAEIQSSLPHIIFNTSVSTSADVKKINQFAVKQSVDLILCSKHTRSDFSTIFLGSFTESLLMASKVPLLIVPNRKQKIDSLKNIAFPVDLVHNQGVVFRKLAQFVKEFSGRLSLVHKLPSPVDPLLQNSSYMLGGGWISVGEFFKLDIKQRKDKLAKLQTKMAGFGVKVKTEMITEPGSIAEGVRKLQKEQAVDMIALNSRARSRTSYFLGSVARAITKEVDCPIWIFHA